MKKRWDPMQLKLVGRVSDLMRGVNGSNNDPGQGAPHKRGNG